MADGFICSSKSEASENGLSNGSLAPRRIKFHLARNPFVGFVKAGGDFRLETLNPAFESARPAGVPGHASGKKSDRPENLENWLDPELTFGITVRKIGAGLENLGNTCFLNSVLQCLTYTEPLAAYLQSGKHQVSCRIAGFCALCAIQKHVSRALQSTGRILAPKDLVSNLRCISRSFRNARQEDAHEYMVNLLESMHKCCLPSGVSSESPSAFEKSLVHKIFGGRLRSQVKCMQCSYCSNKFDPFLDLSLEIIKAESLHKALVHFTAKEQLDGGERQYQCQRCRQKVRALKQLTVDKAPYVLTIHLKRFASHDPGQKIDKKVHFSPTLDLKPFVSGSNEEELKYTLYGVLVHAGWSTRSGHYYCYVRTSTGMWYSLDDNRVFQVSEKIVLEQKAYMLFYVRDRKTSTSKIPVDVWKGALGSNIMESRTCSSSKQVIKETVLNGSSLKRINGTATSAATVERDPTSGNLSNETISRLAAVQNANCFSVTDSFAIKRESELEIPSMDQKEAPMKQAPVWKINSLAVAESSAVKTEPAADITLAEEEEMVLKQAPVQTVNDLGLEHASALNADPALESSLKVPILEPPKGIPDSMPNDGVFISAKALVGTGTKLSGCVDERNSNKKPNVLSTSSGHQNNGTGNLVTEKAFPKVECIVEESADKDLVTGKANENVQDSVFAGLVKSSSTLIKAVESLDVKSRGRKIHKISKKKLLKYGAKSMHLGCKFLLGASLTLQKKKRKRRKQRPQGSEDLSQHNFYDGDRDAADLGPSTSGKTNKISLHSTHSQRKRLKPRKRKANGIVGKVELNACGDNHVEPVDREHRERIDQLSAVLNVDTKQQQKSALSNLTSNQRGISETESLDGGRKPSMQNSVVNILTRGLEDPIVAQWDNIELPPPCRMLESAPADGTSMGYVLDEWDEEYDRGKRKKIRESKRDFGGPNPFQEIATKKAQLKKLKIDRSRSGDRPFRI